MSRDIGLLKLSGNFEVESATPLDARMRVALKSDLINFSTFGFYAYKGMLVVVTDDTDENNGVYRLKNLPYTDINNWDKLGNANMTPDIVNPFRNEFITTDWILDSGEYKLEIPQTLHLQENTKYLQVTVYQTGTKNDAIICDYSVSDTGDITLYSNVQFNGYYIVTDLKKVGNSGWRNENFIIDITIKSNGYIELTYNPKFVLVFLNGFKETTTFYSILGNRLYFNDVNDISEGDYLDINYLY